jgi:hypothetical protein
MAAVGLQETTLSSYLSTLRNQYGWSIPRRGGRPYLAAYVVGRIPGNENAVAVGPNAARAQAEAAANDSWNRGIASDVVAYLEERAMDLASS